MNQINGGPADLQPEEKEHGWTWTDWIRVGKSRWRRLGEKFWRVPSEVKNRRYEICRACEEFVPATTQCRQCRCAMGVKTWFSGVACPLGKWPAEAPPHPGGNGERG